MKAPANGRWTALTWSAYYRDAWRHEGTVPPYVTHAAKTDAAGQDAVRYRGKIDAICGAQVRQTSLADDPTRFDTWVRFKPCRKCFPAGFPEGEPCPPTSPNP